MFKELRIQTSNYLIEDTMFNELRSRLKSINKRVKLTIDGKKVSIFTIVDNKRCQQNKYVDVYSQSTNREKLTVLIVNS